MHIRPIFQLLFFEHGYLNILPPGITFYKVFLENPSSTLLGYSRISNLIRAHFWDFLEIACWYWPDLAIIQATKLGLGIISLNYKQKCGIQAFPTP